MIIWKSQNDLLRDRSTAATHYYYPPKHRRSTCKNSQGNTTVCIFLKAFESIRRGKMEQILPANALPAKNCYCYNHALQKHESNSSLKWWRHQFLWNCHWSFEGDTLELYLQIIFQDGVFSMSIDKKEFVFTLKSARSRLYQEETDRCRYFRWSSASRK